MRIYESVSKNREIRQLGTASRCRTRINLRDRTFTQVSRKSLMRAVRWSECDFHRSLYRYTRKKGMEIPREDFSLVSFGSVVDRNLNSRFYASVRYRKRAR